MGQQQSKEELLHHEVENGNVAGIRALRAQGAGLEYVDKEGKTPLITACMKPELYDVAKCLIELGANVNSYRPGRFGGTPLHHAVKRGLKRTVELLLSNGANALLINDDCQTPLEVARAKGFGEIVRIMESHICLFAGWLRERYGPGFLDTLAPQLLSRKVWAVVVPCGSRNLKKPFKLELAIYATLQDAKPRTTIALWKAHMEETAIGYHDPSVTISEISAMSRRRRRRRGLPRVLRQVSIKLAPANEGDKQQLQQFCSACKGMPQVAHSTFPFNAPTPVASAPIPPVPEDVQLAMAMNASIQSALIEGIPVNHPEPPARPSPSVIAGTSSGAPPKGSIQWQAHEAGPSGASAVTSQGISSPTPESPVVPSAPMIVDEAVDDGPIHYPSIDLDEVEISKPVGDYIGMMDGGGIVGGSSSCVICLDAPVEGACVPCGHMAGCMSCLNEVKAKEWGCPICRTKIDQVIKVYAV